MLQSLMEWLESTSLASFIHDRPWAFTTLEVIHVVAISLVIGTIMLVDLRLLGFASTRRPFVEFARGILPVTWFGFVIAALTGSLMFITRATDYYVSATFLIKMSLIALAGINMLIFEFGTIRGVQDWNVNPTPPRSARLAGAISLACWVAVVIFGRWTGFIVLPQG
jgi:hypothetical protein